jgi:hypothetical protein
MADDKALEMNSCKQVSLHGVPKADPNHQIYVSGRNVLEVRAASRSTLIEK